MDAKKTHGTVLRVEPLKMRFALARDPSADASEQIYKRRKSRWQSRKRSE